MIGIVGGAERTSSPAGVGSDREHEEFLPSDEELRLKAPVRADEGGTARKLD